jgi:hypothetical protein
VPALGDELDAERRIAELERTAQRLQRQLATAKAKSAELVEAVYQAAHDAAVVVGSPKPVPAPKHKAGKGDPEEALLVLTDWQMGKRTDSYDTDICVQRIRHVVERTRRITEIHRKDHPVPGCTIAFLGDHVEGTAIFEGQAWEVDSTGYSQLLTASSLMSEIVLTLLQDFDTVTVHSVHGNHGRLGRRGQMPREDNLDLIAYAIARSHLAGQDRVTWAENTKWYDHIQIGNLGILAVHGDQIRGYTAGTPASALARRFTAWSSSMPFDWQEALCGHYHQNIVVTLPNGAMVRMTPSVETGSVYAAEMMGAASAKGGQRLLYVHPEKGAVTSEYMIWLD